MHRVHWRRGVCFFQMVMALGWGLETSSASACSPLPPVPRFSTLGDSVPADGATDVLPEGLIRVSHRSWVVRNGSTMDWENARHDVTVIDLETGAAVKGTLNFSPWGEADVQYWKPDSRLLPNRRYALQQSLTQKNSRPEEAQGPTQSRSTFSTGNRQVLPLGVLGRLEAQVNPYQATPCDDSVPSLPCGGCGATRQELRHGIQFRVPAIQGGFTFGTYRVEVVVTHDTPHDFSRPASTQILYRDITSRGEPVEGLLELPLKASTSATPCVAWRVLDILGNVGEGAPVCLKAAPTGTGVEPPGPKPVPDAPGYLGFGCSLGGAGAAPAALGLLALWVRGRRRATRAS